MNPDQGVSVREPKWSPMSRFAERYRDFGLDKHEWKPMFGFGRWAVIVIRAPRKGSR